MKMYFLSFLICLTSCAPVYFSKIDTTPKVPDSVFKKYVNGEVSREETLVWFFSDSADFRNKVYDSKMDLENLELTTQKIDRILVLQLEMNSMIQKFNNRFFVSRAWSYTGSMVNAYRSKNTEATGELHTLRNEGADSDIVSDSVNGFFNSIFKNGLQIQEVDFLSLSEE